MRRDRRRLFAWVLALVPAVASARSHHGTVPRVDVDATAADVPPPGVVGLVSERETTVADRSYVQRDECTGFAIDTPSGQQIATARHCVRDGAPVTVYDDQRRAAGIHAVMPRGGPDVALVAADDGVRFPAVDLADSHALRRGDGVCAWRVRSSGGTIYWDRSCARFLMRRVVDTGEGPHEMLLIEHALRPGFSGGPVFDAAGRVIGMGVATSDDFDLIEPIEHLAALWSSEREE